MGKRSEPRENARARGRGKESLQRSLTNFHFHSGNPGTPQSVKTVTANVPQIRKVTTACHAFSRDSFHSPKQESFLAGYLRANFCKYRESGDSFKIFNFFIFSPNKAFSELFSKIQLKDPKALEFFQNRGKFENRHFGLSPPLKIDKNDAFSFRSCW